MTRRPQWTVTLESGETGTRALPVHRDRHPVGPHAAAHSRASRASAAPPTTRRAGRTRRWISPASASASSAPAPPRSRRSRRSPSRRSISPSSSAGRTGPRRCTMPRSARRRWRRSRAATRRSTPTAPRRRAGSSTSPTRARRWSVPPEEREAFWEKLYAEPGFGIWMGNFRDILIDEKANAAISEFIAQEDSPAREGPEGRGEADPERPRIRHPPRAAGKRLFRGLQPRQRLAGRYVNESRSSASRRTASRRARRNTNSTS